MFSSRERTGKSEGPSELGPSSCEHQEEESWGELKGLSFVEMDVLYGGEGQAWPGASVSPPVSLQGLGLPAMAPGLFGHCGRRQACIGRPELTFVCASPWFLVRGTECTPRLQSGGPGRQSRLCPFPGCDLSHPDPRFPRLQIGATHRPCSVGLLNYGT